MASPACLRVLDEPVHGDVNVDRILCADRVAAQLAVGDRFQVEFLNQCIDPDGSVKVVLVAEDQGGNTLEGRLGEQIVQLAL